MARLARAGNRMKAPRLFACPDMKSANVSGRRSVTLAHREAENDEVLIDGRRRAKPINEISQVALHSGPQIYDATGPEIGIRFPRARIQGEEPPVRCGHDDA